jgi:hypothetical protein
MNFAKSDSSSRLTLNLQHSPDGILPTRLCWPRLFHLDMHMRLCRKQCDTSMIISLDGHFDPSFLCSSLRFVFPQIY